MYELPKIVLSEPQFLNLLNILRFIDADDESFVRNSLKLRKLVFDSKPFGFEKHTYLQVYIKWSNPSIGGTDLEKALIRRAIKTAQEEENALNLLLNLYEGSEDSQDTEAQMLIIRAIAELM